MKKFIAIAALAVCATAVQAVNVEWTKTTISNGSVDLSAYNGQTLSVAVVVKMSAVPTVNSNAAFFKLLTSGYDTSLGVGNSGSNRFAWGSWGVGTDSPAYNAKLKLGQFTAEQFADGEVTVVLGVTFRVATVNGSTLLVNDYYGNGVLVSGESGIYSSSIDGTLPNYESFMLGDLAQDAKVYVSTTAATAADFAALPEPGVMALLALGVGAIALKRKVA